MDTPDVSQYAISARQVPYATNWAIAADLKTNDLAP